MHRFLPTTDKQTVFPLTTHVCRGLVDYAYPLQYTFVSDIPLLPSPTDDSPPSSPPHSGGTEPYDLEDVEEADDMSAMECRHGDVESHSPDMYRGLTDG